MCRTGQQKDFATKLYHDDDDDDVAHFSFDLAESSIRFTRERPLNVHNTHRQPNTCQQTNKQTDKGTTKIQLCYRCR